MSCPESRGCTKKTVARLLEAWAAERRVPLTALGWWTGGPSPREHELQPEQCYASTERHDRPDLAIDVVLKNRAGDMLAVYRELGIPEVWLWEEGELHVHVLRGEAFVAVERSELLPDAPLEAFTRFLEQADQSQAVFDFVDWLRQQRS